MLGGAIVLSALDQSIASIAAQVQTGQLSSVRLVSEALNRIRFHNGSLNCFTRILESEALSDAARVDRQIASGINPGVLSGVPFACKDLFDVKGLSTTAGAKNRITSAPATSDAEVVRRLKNEGAILVGTLNMDEYAYGFATMNAHFGATRNPHDTRRLAGGSSGGSASAVSAGLVPFSIGSDTNGSVRVPAGLCGIFGIRPAENAIPMQGVFPFVKSLDTVGPFARSIEDLLIVYGVLANPSNERASSSVSGTTSDEPSIRDAGSPSRIARLGGWFEQNVTNEVLEAVQALMTHLGCDAVVNLPEAEAARSASYVITAAQGGALHLDTLQKDAMSYDPAVRDRLIAGTMVPFGLYNQAVQFREYFRKQVEKQFESFDLLIAPCTPCVAPFVDAPNVWIDGKSVPARANLGIFTQPLSIVGMPILSVPWMRPLSSDLTAEKGLPIGIQIATWPGRENLLFAFAKRLESGGLIGSRCPIQHIT